MADNIVEKQAGPGGGGSGNGSGGGNMPACPPDQTPPQQVGPYALVGPQVEPESAYWTAGPTFLQVANMRDVLRYTEDATKPEFFVEPYPTAPATLQAEIAELAALATHRDDPLPQGSVSDFIQLQSAPFGAIFNLQRAQFAVTNVNTQHLRRDDLPKHVVLTGRELARMFEIETPGLYHRHALTYLLYNRPDISPTRQARIWAALDLTIYSALSAAWFFKWGYRNDVSYRQRPYEYDRGASFQVLFDNGVSDDGAGDDGPRGCPCPSPGTPRHPAYPSGHSTFSAAGSRILEYFFPDETQHLELLATNIGEARLWAGVHWRTDHDAGQRIGRAVAQVMIDQLQKDCVPPVDTRTCPMHPNDPVPTKDQVRDDAFARRYGNCDQAQDTIPPRPPGVAAHLESGTF